MQAIETVWTALSTQRDHIGVPPNPSNPRPTSLLEHRENSLPFARGLTTEMFGGALRGILWGEYKRGASA
jgi:hypothetical protein